MKIKNADLAHVIDLFQNQDVQAGLDFLLGKQAEYREARSVLKAPYFTMLGQCYSKLGNYAKADECFDISIGAVPRNFRAWIEMASSYMQRGRLHDAEKILLELTAQVHTDDTGYTRELLKMTGKFFKLKGDFRSSIYFYEEHLKATNKPTSTARDIACLYEWLENGSTSIESMDGTLDYAFHLRRQKLRGSDPIAIATTFLKNRLKDITNPMARMEVHSALAQFYLEAGKSDLARHYNQAALDIDSNNPRTLSTRIRLLISVVQPDAVRAQFEDDGCIILQDPKIACALARTFHLAGFDDLTRHIANDILSNARTTAEERKSAQILLHSNPIPPERRP